MTASKKKSASRPVAPVSALKEMKVGMWGIDQPIAYARNARKISQAAVDKVAGSIKEFGWRQPIVVDKEGVIVAGHTRLLAAKKLRLTHVPVHVAEDLTAAQIKAYRLADNRTGEETEWDRELLHLELTDLAPDFSNLDIVTGFDMPELEKLFAIDGESSIVGSKELDPEEFQTFEHACPKCGFEFD